MPGRAFLFFFHSWNWNYEVWACRAALQAIKSDVLSRDRWTKAMWRPSPNHTSVSLILRYEGWEKKRRFGQGRDIMVEVEAEERQTGRPHKDGRVGRKIFWGAKFAAIVLQYFDNFLISLLLMCFGMNFSDEQGSSSDPRVTDTFLLLYAPQIKDGLMLQSI